MRSILLIMTLVACQTSAEVSTPVAEKSADQVEAPAPETASEAKPAVDDAKWKYFGEAFTVSETKSLADTLSGAEAQGEAAVRVSGELAEVCQKMGCWAVIRDDQGNSVRITMKDHAFGIDKDTEGRACEVEGQLVSKPVDPEQLAHYASEGAKEHPEAGKSVAWSLVASSVAVARN